MTRISKRKLASMIEDATVDAYDESEQASGWHTMLEDPLALPFETTVLGVVGTCGHERQVIPILDLPLPTPKPAGAEWIEAYRHWLGA